MAGYLTTHVLDTAKGAPAEGIKIVLYRLGADARTQLVEVVTNSDGRTDGPILPPDSFSTGKYELIFHAGDYLRQSGQAGQGILFLDQIPLQFGMSDADSHYHVPLLLSPFSYSTYRGS